MKNIKAKITRLVLCSIIIFSIKFLFHYLFPVIPISELGPASALPPILGLMFGPWGAAGAALGYLASDITAGYSPEIYIISFFVQFLYGYIPYKLWYTLDMGESNSLPRLDTVKNLMKFVVIMFINAAVMAGLLGFLIDGLGLYNLVSLTTLIFAFNNFDFSIMFGTLIIIGANFYGISMFKPAINKKPLLSPKIFDIVGITAIIIAVLNGIYSLFAAIDIWAFSLGAITYTLALIYIFKPITKEIKKKTNPIKISLTERLIVVFIVIGAIIAMVTGIVAYLTISSAGGDEIQFWEAVYLNITLILSIFYISSIGFLWYIEKNITTPIESISDIVKSYVSNSNGITNSQLIISKCEEYATPQSEVGILALSFQRMIRDLEIYLKNLKNVTAEKERINAELNVAKKIQEDLLPHKFPKNDEFEVYAVSIPAKEVGGDFYDFFLIDEDQLAVIIADVSGKGVPAALFMVIAKTLIKNYTQLGKSPAEVFSMVNNQLYEGNDASMFVTAWMGVLEIGTGKFTYVSAGHNQPLLKTTGKEYDWIKSEAGFVLGGMEDIHYQQNEISLKPGDRVYLYTDGVTEATTSDDELFGDTRLLQVMNINNDISLKQQLSYVKKEVDSFIKDGEQFDDITMLIMEYKNKK